MVDASRSALIVEDGSALHVLAAVRSLGRAGWRVGLGIPGEGSRSRASKYVAAVHHVPRPEDDLDAFAVAVTQAVERGGYDVVFPGDDVELLALSARRDAIPVIVPLAPHEVVLRTVDKLAIGEVAIRHGIGVPVTVEATASNIESVALPVMVKARLHWTPGSGGGQRHLLVRMCDDRDEVRRRVTDVEDAGGSAILQEIVDGDLMAVGAVVDGEGRLVCFSQQRTTMASVRRTSVRAVTTDIDPELEDKVKNLLDDLGWFGMANLQFIDVAGRGPLLIDFNGRYYGSMALAIAAGADLPARWADIAIGRSASGTVRAAPGWRYHNFEEDLWRARAQRRGGLVADVMSVIRAFPGAVHAMWLPADPGPAMAFGRRMATRLVGRATDRLRSSNPRGRAG